MMRKTIEASLVLSLSVVIALLVVVIVIPRHPVLGQRPAVDGSMIRPAVFVEGIHHRVKPLPVRAAPSSSPARMPANVPTWGRLPPGPDAPRCRVA